MNRKTLLHTAALLFVLFPVKPVEACMNSYVPNQKAMADSADVVRDLTEVRLYMSWPDRLESIQKEMETRTSHELQNDLGTALVHVGSADQAIPIFLRIEKEHPGLYRTASNLGTAYELAGDPVRALEWIRKGIERNPASHEGTEWLHVRILETKIAHAQDPGWYPESSILGLDFGQTKPLQVPAVLPKGNTGIPITLDELEAALKYQLHERLQFVHAPDPIVASLLVDFGDTVALKHQNLGLAAGVYQLAIPYAQAPRASVLASRIHERERAAVWANRYRAIFPSSPVGWVLLIAALAAIAAYLVGLFRHWRRQRIRFA